MCFQTCIFLSNSLNVRQPQLEPDSTFSVAPAVPKGANVLHPQRFLAAEVTARSALWGAEPNMVKGFYLSFLLLLRCACHCMQSLLAHYSTSSVFPAGALRMWGVLSIQGLPQPASRP